MITRMKLLKRANKKSNKKIKDLLHSENIAKELLKGICYRKLTVKETIFAKHKVRISNSIIIGKIRNKKPILYCFYYTIIDDMTNVIIQNKRG